MRIPTLRVRARQGIVTRYDLVDHNIMRKVGRKYLPNSESPNGFAWVDTNETEELPYMNEFITAIRDGSLWAADEETATAVWGHAWRDHFDPSFGTAPGATKPRAHVDDQPMPGSFADRLWKQGPAASHAEVNDAHESEK